MPYERTPSTVEIMWNLHRDYSHHTLDKPNDNPSEAYPINCWRTLARQSLFEPIELFCVFNSCASGERTAMETNLSGYLGQASLFSTTSHSKSIADDKPNKRTKISIDDRANGSNTISMLLIIRCDDKRQTWTAKKTYEKMLPLAGDYPVTGPIPKSHKKENKKEKNETRILRDDSLTSVIKRGDPKRRK